MLRLRLLLSLSHPAAALHARTHVRSALGKHAALRPFALAIAARVFEICPADHGPRNFHDQREPEDLCAGGAWELQGVQCRVLMNGYNMSY